MRQGTGPELRRNLAAFAIVSVVYLGISLLVTNGYYQLILTLVPVWALFGVSWNILSGYGGQLSFGHASFFGIGAYTVTLAVVYWSLSPWLGIVLGMILGGLAAILIGLPTFRLRGHYFALSMLAYPLAILYVLQYLGFQEVSLPMHRDRYSIWRNRVGKARWRSPTRALGRRRFTSPRCTRNWAMSARTNSSGS